MDLRVLRGTKDTRKRPARGPNDAKASSAITGSPHPFGPRKRLNKPHPSKVPRTHNEPNVNIPPTSSDDFIPRNKLRGTSSQTPIAKPVMAKPVMEAIIGKFVRLAST